MNDIQKEVIERLRRDILLSDGLGERFVGGYEYKTFRVEEYTIERTFPEHRSIPWVHLFTEVGGKGDEGTMAAVLCRTRRLIQIGPEGGVRSLIGKKVQGYGKVLIWGKEH